MVVIIGAGLSGLMTAYRLKQAGIPFKVLEARSRVGGRIHTTYSSAETPVELGATWFTHQHRNLIHLLKELGIGYFEQYMEGAAFYQPLLNGAVQQVQIPSQAPSYRISGGTSNLIDTLRSKLYKSEIVLNEEVKKIKFTQNSVQVLANEVFEASKVVLAIPPKLWVKNIVFTPDLPIDLAQVAHLTHTWMEDSIKVGVTYSSPFWENKNLSGTLFSNGGPITEFYDHCNHERNTYALCGFAHSSLHTLNKAQRKARVVDYVTQVFGDSATAFTGYVDCVWREEPFTSTASETALYPHQNNGNSIYRTAYFDERLFISSAEASPQFPGYMDGAVFAGEFVAKKLLALQAQK